MPPSTAANSAAPGVAASSPLVLTSVHQILGLPNGPAPPVGPSPKTETPMVAELLRRKQALLTKAAANTLALSDVSDHQLHLGKITNTLRETREHIVRKHQLTEALLHQCRDARRRQKFEDTQASLLRQEESFNYNFRRVREEAAWFFSTAAFKLAQEHVIKTWEVTKSGEWYNREELEAEQNTLSFEQLLKEMHEEDGTAPVGFFTRAAPSSR